MEMTHELHRTEELLHKGLKEINDKGELNNSSLDVLGKTLDAIKDLCEIKADDENRSYGGHHGGMWTAEGSYGRRMPDYSYGRMFGRRDGGGDGRYYEGYYGHDGYGRNESYGRDYSYGHNQDMVENLRRDLQNATSEQEREYIRNMIRKYEK